MADRRALIVAPLYDGTWLPPLVGSPVLVDRLSTCLKTHGGYSIEVLNGIVTPELFRAKAAAFFDSPGELLLYFYGHGCVGIGDLGNLATFEAAQFREGVLMLEVGAMVRKSQATEVVLIYDCCHAGKASVTSEILGETAKGLESSEGRDLLAACSAHQIGWETSNKEHKQLGAFSAHVLEGLEGGRFPEAATAFEDRPWASM